MSDTPEAFRIFVAMPGTSMGADASWNNPAEIKQLFYGGIQSHAAMVLNRKVDLVIEVDRQSSGSIYNFMFRECWDADAYIADLTGSNPNVYLELGARWSLRDRVTVVVSQDVSKLEFNARSVHAIPYAKDADRMQTAIESVVAAIVNGLHSNHNDSPIRDALSDVFIVTSAEHEKLLEYPTLTRQLSAAYVDAGRLAQKSDDRLGYFRRAVVADARYPQAWVETCSELRNRSQYMDAIQTAKDGLIQLPGVAALHAQMGVAYTKQGLIDSAVSELTYASDLAQDDPEVWSNLGGALRRKAFESQGAGAFNVHYAIRARECYRKALSLAEPDLSQQGMGDRAYALGNIARLGFVLSYYDPTEKFAAHEALHRLRDLCREALHKDPNDPYRRFDLADTYLLDGQIEDGCRLYREGIEAVASEYRSAVLSSVGDPLRQYVTIGLGDRNLRTAMEELLHELQQAAPPRVA